MASGRFIQDKVHLPAARTFEHDTGGSVYCMATNKDFTMAVCAGRSILKLFSIENEKIEERMNLRSGQKTNLSFSANDIVWSPHDESTLASASTNGSIVIWDLNRSNKNKQEDILQHERTIYRLCYHPVENLLLSGSRGHLSLYDVRKKEMMTFNCRSTIHDVQWWPQDNSKFAAATDNGSIQIWDYRYTAAYVNELSAHSGPVFAIDFHPEHRDFLATGGRDMMIKVWNLNEQTNQAGQLRTLQVHQITTIASVCRIKWRPARQAQISSVAMNLDNGVNVWDLDRPYIPVAMFSEHSDSVTGLAWKDSHTLLTAGKDCKLIQHSYCDAERPAERANPVAIDISNTDEIALAIKRPQLNPVMKSPSNQSLQSPSVQTSATQKITNFLHSSGKSKALSKETKREAFVKGCQSLLYNFSKQIKEFDGDWFKFCATNYIIHGKSFEEMCQHNANIAEQYNQLQIMKHWQLLRLGYGSIVDTSAVDQKTAPRNPDAVRPSIMKHDNDAVQALNNGSEVHFTDGDTSAQSDADSSDEHTAANQTHDFFYEDNEIDAFDEFDEDMDQVDDLDCYLPTEGFTVITDQELIVAQDESPQYTPSRSIPTPHQPPVEHSNGEIHRRSDGFKPPEQVRVAAIESLPMWGPSEFTAELLADYVEHGDVQTAVSMLMVLGNKIKSSIKTTTAEGWIGGYLELLEKYKLWKESTTIIKRCGYQRVAALNQRSTVTHIICSKCSKALATGKGWYCQKCRANPSACSLCHLPVKGIYVWCQGCYHGGHIQHMQDWFNTHTQCPTGCGHSCQYT